MKLAFILNDICNLNCASCAHYAPIADYKNVFYADFEKFKQNCVKLKNICDVTCVEFMGGEPLLNKDVVKYIDFASNLYKDEDVKVVLVTNGLLLLNFLTKENVAIFQRKNVTIAISEYPVEFNYGLLRKILKNFKINYHINIDFSQDEWMKPQLKERNQKIAGRCGYREEQETLVVKNDYIYGCALAMNCYLLNERFNTKFVLGSNDFIDINKATKKTIGEFVKKGFEHGFDFCKYCNKVAVPWSKSKKKADEWIK